MISTNIVYTNFKWLLVNFLTLIQFGFAMVRTWMLYFVKVNRLNISSTTD